MNDHDHTIRIFTGSEIDALALRALLEEAGISSMIRNDYQSGMLAGFVAGFPSESELYISDADREAAEPTLAGFLTRSEPEEQA
jgi:hypothetical protein